MNANRGIAARLLMFAAPFAFLVTAVAAQAADLVVTRYFSGLWDQPHQESQGIMLQIVDTDPEVKHAVAYWFTYGEDLESAWFIGIGQAEGDQVVLDMYSVSGVGFMEDAVPEVNNAEPVGGMVLSFRNCNHGAVSYDMGDAPQGSGEFEIKKLAGLFNSRCSGGISDDTPGSARPVKLEVDLLPAREDVSGKGKAKFWERADRSDFHVSAEDIADGDYDILVCGAVVGTMPVTSGYGHVEYRSPDAEGKTLLTFNPRNCPIALHDAEGAVLSSNGEVLAPKTPPGQGGGQGMSDTTVSLESTGVIPGAEGEATLQVKMNSTEFEVEIENVPQGTYPVDVGGMEQGQIGVNPSGKGKLRFSDPQKEDRLPLGFDPRAEWIEVRSGDDVILEAAFPE